MKGVLVSILMFLSSNLWAGDHLEPEESIYSGDFFLKDYESQLLTYFGEFYQNGVMLRLISIPSFSPEYALAIIKENNRYYVLHQKPERQLWSYQMELPFKLNQLDELNAKGVVTVDEYENKLKEIAQSYPENPMEMPRVSCRKEINEKLTLDVHELWMKMLLQTKYSPEPSSGVDGQTYHFSAPMHGMVLNYAGKVWSPEPNTKTGLLVDISDLLVEYCLKPDEGKITKLLKKKANLLKERI